MVDLNRQPLDRVVPDLQVQRLQGMFTAAGRQVVTLEWGRFISTIFNQPGSHELRRRLEEMPNEEYQRMLRVPAVEIADRILADQTFPPGQLRPRARGPSAGDAIHAGISAKGAIVTMFTGTTTQGKEHGTSARELRAVLGTRPEAVLPKRRSRELITITGHVEYGTTLITLARAEPLVRRAHTLVDLARQIVRPGH